MQSEEWNVSAVSLSPELLQLAAQKQERLSACRQAAENGNEAAITELGIHYFYGTGGVSYDPNAAFFWLSRTSPENAAGRCLLGVCYIEGIGTERDVHAAAELFRECAAQGFPPAQYELGLCYEHGLGVLQDLKRAAELYAQSAEQKEPLAQFALGNLYFMGRGVPADKVRAAELYARAAEQDLDRAMCCLAECYEFGEGVPYDLDKAIELFERAAGQGNADALEDACRLRLLRSNLRRKWDFGRLEA